MLLFQVQNIFPYSALTWKSYAFVALITFAAYFYLKAICFSSHYPGLEKPSYVNWVMLTIIGLGAIYFLLQFETHTQLVICAIGSIGIFYHNHTSFHLLRNVPLLKNISISLCWVLLLYYCFQENDLTNPKRFFYALDFFLILLAQSLLFDFQDAEEDREFFHHTLSNSLSSNFLKLMISILFLLSFMISIYFYAQDWMNLSSVLILAIIYLAYFNMVVRACLESRFKRILCTDLILIFKTL